MRPARLSQLRWNVFSGGLTTALGALVSLVSYPVYLAYLGYDTFGLWVILNTVVAVAQVGNLGLSAALTKLVAEENGRGGHRAIAQYSSTATALLGAIGLAVAVVAMAGRGWIAIAFGLTGAAGTQVSTFIPWVALLSAWVLILQVPQGVLTGLGRMDQFNYVSFLAQVLGFAVALGMLALGLGMASMVLAGAVSAAFTHISCVVLIRRAADLPRGAGVSRHAARRLLHFGAPIFGASLLNLLLQPFNKIVVSRRIGVDALPLLEIAFSAAFALRGLVEAGMRALTPEISRMVGAGREEMALHARALARRAFWIVLGLGSPIFAFVIVFAPAILRAWLGSRFVSGQVDIFRIATGGALVSLLGVTAYYVLLGLGRVWTIFLAHVVQSLLNVAVVLGTMALAGYSTLAMVGWGWVAGASGATLLLLLAQGQAIPWRAPAPSRSP
jgi:O-antigen/teichoic acid export membrane protein